MTKPNVDDPNAEGVSAEPTAPASQVAGGTVEGLAELLPKLVKDAIAEELKPIKGDISGIYSRQDKDRNEIREFMDEYKKQKASGKSDADAERDAQQVITTRERDAKRDQIIDRLAEQFLNSPSPQSAGNGASGAVDIALVLQNAQLDVKDPNVAVLQAQLAGKSEAEVYAAIGKFVATRNTQPAPTSATQPAAQSSQPMPADVGGLTQEYQEKMKAARGNKALATQIKESYRNKGVPVDDIMFGV